ncbi:MAG: hypothetical protein WC551_05685 [Patescibacteria group bacterium]
MIIDMGAICSIADLENDDRFVFMLPTKRQCLKDELLNIFFGANNGDLPFGSILTSYASGHDCFGIVSYDPEDYSRSAAAVSDAFGMLSTNVVRTYSFLFNGLAIPTANRFAIMQALARSPVKVRVFECPIY